MQGHLRVLAALLIVYGAFGALVGLIVLLLFGGLATAAGLASEAGEGLIAVPLLAAIGTFTAAVLLALSLPRVLAGIGLLKGWAWVQVPTMIVVAVGVFDFPFGTAVGLYGFWVLTRPDFSRALADQRRDGTIGRTRE